MADKLIEFAITAGGWPFDGAKEAITALHRMGVPTSLASGDRVTNWKKWQTMVLYSPGQGVWRCNTTVKAQIVNDLRQNMTSADGRMGSMTYVHQNADMQYLLSSRPGDRPEESTGSDYVVKT